MAKLKVEEDKDRFYFVNERNIYSDEGWGIYNVWMENDQKLSCDGDAEQCENRSCNHIRAVERFRKKTLAV